MLHQMKMWLNSDGEIRDFNSIIMELIVNERGKTDKGNVRRGRGRLGQNCSLVLSGCSAPRQEHTLQ